MKISLEVKEIKKNHFECVLKANKHEDMVTQWEIEPARLVEIEHKGIDKEMLALNNLGKQLLSKFARVNMYPPGDPMMTPAQRKEELEKDKEE